jgi:uncharacterized protein (TIRG00374 family)
VVQSRPTKPGEVIITKKNTISTTSLLLSLLALILLIVLLVLFVDMQSVLQQLRQANRLTLLVGSVFLVAGYVAYAIRWQSLLVRKPRLFATFHVSNIGNLANTLLPVRPGDALRIFLLGEREKVPLLEVTSSVAVERWLEQIMRLAAFGGAVVFGAGGAVSQNMVLGSVAFLAATFAFMLWMIKRRDFVLARFPAWLARIPRLTEAHAHRALSDLLDGLQSISSLQRMSVALLWSIITWSLFWVFHYLCLLAIDPNLPLNIRLALTLGSLALVPPSAATVPGVYQVSMVVPLALIGYDEELLTSYSLVMNATEMALILMLGLWGMINYGLSLRQLIGQAPQELPEKG